jgi:hypothetical protein
MRLIPQRERESYVRANTNTGRFSKRMTRPTVKLLQSNFTNVEHHCVTLGTRHCLDQLYLWHLRGRNVDCDGEIFSDI